MSELSWPPEQARPADASLRWTQTRSNICLDFHGDPVRARAVLFSDGNHHMALAECLQRFLLRHPAAQDVFYATTPPGVLLQWLEAGALHLGNLCLNLVPQVIISPPAVLDRLVQAGRIRAHVPYMRSRGNVLLVCKGNPLGIHGIEDLLRSKARLFISNPATESASYQVYADTLKALAHRSGSPFDWLDHAPGVQSNERVVYGEGIHHREAPQALADGRADVALVYYHLALRYVRIFPERFEFIPVGGAPEHPEPGNRVSDVHLAVVGDGGAWGEALRESLLGSETSEIYARHGLRRIQD